MGNIAFDNDKYLRTQSEHIRQRIAQFGGKLYLEFGGKLYDDNHASRVLPGFQPDSKLKMLLQLKEQVEMVIAINAADIEKNKIRGDLGITYDQDVIRLIDIFRDFLLRPSYKAYRKGFMRMWVLPNRLKRVTKLGLPIAFQQGLEAATFSLTAIMVGWIGSIELAAHQVVIAISTISFTTYLGLGSATAIRTSFYKGAKDWDQVRKTTFAGIHLGLIVSTITCIALFAFRNQISFVFSDDPQVATIVIMLLPILMLYDGA